jgi:hypothetical protein
LWKHLHIWAQTVDFLGPKLNGVESDIQSSEFYRVEVLELVQGKVIVLTMVQSYPQAVSDKQLVKKFHLVMKLGRCIHPDHEISVIDTYPKPVQSLSIHQNLFL